MLQELNILGNDQSIEGRGSDVGQLLNADIWSSFPLRTYKKNEFVFDRGVGTEHLHFVHQGRVKVGSYLEFGRTHLSGLYHQGEFFGDLSFGSMCTTDSFAKAVDPVTKVRHISISSLSRKGFPNKNFIEILHFVGRQVQVTQQNLTQLQTLNSRSRIIKYLKLLSIKCGKKIGYEIMIPNGLTHQDLASLVGTSRQTVTTVLSELSCNNIIHVDRRRILIRDIKKLD